MTKKLNLMIQWCDRHAGFLTFLTFLLMIVLAIPYNNIDLGFAAPWLDKIYLLLLYKVKIPLFTFILLALIWLLYFKKIRNRYKKNNVDIEFLTGYWKNEWTVEGVTHSENCQIKQGGKYFIMSTHYFDLLNFKYDYKTNTISFMKSGVQPGDSRTAVNELKIINNDLIKGREENYDIRYTRQL
ncbi:MAG: hypothetical protein ABI166_11860 [Mucilaginibacter sp.]